jgi:HEAT repeat protein
LLDLSRKESVMSLHRCVFALILLGLSSSAAVSESPSPPPLAVYDETTLRRANFDTSAAGVLSQLRFRTRTDGDPRHIRALITQLSNPDFQQRERALRELKVIGQPALPALREAEEHDGDPEVRRRARQGVQYVESLEDQNVAMALVRRAIYLRVSGAAEYLLALLPAVDWEIQDEIFRGLPLVALRDGKLDPALLVALKDPSSLRRAAAALAVAQAGSEAERQRIHPLLDDREPEVRLRAAQGLLAIHDLTSLPVLIALLNEENVEVSWSAEELLHWVAVTTAPAATVGAASAVERQKAVAAWTAWHKVYAAKIDWEEVEQAPRRPGLYLACMNRGVWLGGCDGKRWVLERSAASHDALLQPGNQLLIVPNAGHKLIQCTLAGEKQWERLCADEDYVMCQRLPNGHLFLVSDTQADEITAEGQEVSSTKLERGERLSDAWKLRNGEMQFNGEKNESLKKCAFLPDGHRIVADRMNDRVLEVDSCGNTLRALRVCAPVSVEALPGGNNLVSASPVDPRILELDSAGRTLWEVAMPATAHRVRWVLGRVRIGFDKPRPPGFNLDTSANRVRGLQHADPEVRRRAASLLGFHRPVDALSLQVLNAALDDPEAEVRAEVRATLGLIGEPAAAALSRALKIGTHKDRLHAIRELEGLERGAKQAVPDLIDVVNAGRVARELHRAGPVLSPFGSVTKQTFSLLLAVAPSAVETDELCLRAIVVLYNIGPEAQAALPALLDVLKDSSRPEAIRYEAARAVGRLGPAAKRAIPVYSALLRDPNLSFHLTHGLLGGLELMGADGVLTVAQAANEGNAATRCAALQFLITRGDEASPALPAVEKALKDPDERVRGIAQTAQRLIVTSLNQKNATLLR